MNCLRIHSGDDFLRPFVDVVFHRGNLGLGVEQIGVRVNGDHVTHGRLVCQLVGLHIFVYYRTNRAAAEFIACPSGYTIHFFREADLSEIPSADCKSAVICHTVDLTGNFMYSGMSLCIRSDRGLYRDTRIGAPIYWRRNSMLSAPLC